MAMLQTEFWEIAESLPLATYLVTLFAVYVVICVAVVGTKRRQLFLDLLLAPVLAGVVSWVPLALLLWSGPRVVHTNNHGLGGLPIALTAFFLDGVLFLVLFGLLVAFAVKRSRRALADTPPSEPLP